MDLLPKNISFAIFISYFNLPIMLIISAIIESKFFHFSFKLTKASLNDNFGKFFLFPILIILGSHFSNILCHAIRHYYDLKIEPSNSNTNLVPENTRIIGF